MPSYRGRLHRNVQLWDLSAPDKQEVAGFWQHGNVDIATFFDWLDRILTFDGDRDARGVRIIDRADLGVYPVDSGFAIVAGLPCLHDRPRDCIVPLGNYVFLTRSSLTPVPCSEINDIVQPIRPLTPRSAIEFGIGADGDYSDDYSDDCIDDGMDDHSNDCIDDGMDDHSNDCTDDGMDDHSNDCIDDGMDDHSNDCIDDGMDDHSDDFSLDRIDDRSDDGSENQSVDYVSLAKRRDGDTCMACGRTYMIEVAHIVPRAFTAIWQTHGFQDRVSASQGCGPTCIDSVQNALTLCTLCHGRWGAYMFTVNVDANYQLIDFEKIFGLPDPVHSRLKVAGQPHERPLDDLLRWHYAQVIHANVGGTSRPAQGYVEVDYEEYDDTWCDQAGGQEMFEAELGNRLNHLVP